MAKLFSCSELESFQCGKVEEGKFRYCGKDIEQDDDHNTYATCKDSTVKIRKAEIGKTRFPGDPLNAEEKTEMKSIAGSLAWIARQCRPDLAYRVSRIQSASSNGCVADLREANKYVDYAIATASRGLTFRTGILSWSLQDPMISCVISDASHANESEDMTINGKVYREPHRSQGGRLICLGTDTLRDKDEGGIHIISFSSTIVRRVCRLTMQAEAYSLQAGVEEGDRIRAAICDIFNQLDRKRWERSASKFMKQVWFSDCRSVVDSLLNPCAAKPADKRLSIELASMRQSLWRTPGERERDPFLQDERPRETTDELGWIDMEVMITDPLTKIMDPVKLVQALETNRWNVEQPINSVIVKKAKQLQRRKTIAESLPENYRKICHKPGEYHVDQNLVIISHDTNRMKASETHQYRFRTTWIKNQDDGKRQRKTSCTKT